MPQQIIIAEQMRIAALLTDERVDELIVAQGRYQIGDIYLGTVESRHPGLDAAFIRIGDGEKNGFLHVDDLGPLRRKKASTGITELLDFEQKVLVQVVKEPTGNKGPRLSGKIELPGRYLILQPNGQGVNISRINSESERNRLRAIGVLIKPPGTGLVIRSEAESVNEELIISDLESLLKKWESIQQDSESLSPPKLINRDEDFIHKVLRDHIGPNLSKIVTDNSSAVKRIEDFLINTSQNVIVEEYKESINLIKHYRIDLAIQNALQPRVDLPSGGYIIIEPTEALTVIDVNSGSGNRSNPASTVLWTNCEAAKEIARQLKLRNIGGVIIVDFIDMDPRKDQLQLLEHFTSAIQNDSARPQIAQLTELGLVELTRKREGQNIYELFSKSCPNCYGLGHLPLTLEESITEESPISKNPCWPLVSNDLKNSEEYKKGKQEQNISLNNNQASSVVNSNSSLIPNTNLISVKDVNDEKTSSEAATNKQKPELITVNINQEEEEVYSNLGLNPSLLIEDMDANENLIVHIVRPGESSEEIMKKAKVDKALQNSTRQRKKNRYPQKSINKVGSDMQNPETQDELLTESENEEERESLNLEISTEESKDVSTESDNPEAVSSIEDEDPRRKRRRSSQESKEINTESDNPEAISSIEDEDPRRKRRRSSASS